jgi:hypothetical protein
MLTIYQYPVQVGEFTIELPEYAQYLTVQVQGEQPVMWALGDPDELRRRRRFLCVEAGSTIDADPDELRYIGTFQLSGGALISHLFEIRTGPC